MRRGGVWSLRMISECLVSSSMRLGVPFIAPRQLGAVESNPRRQILPFVDWRTGQSGAPLDTVRCRYPSLFGEADRWSLRAVGAPDSPVHQCDRWLGHASRAESSADRCLGHVSSRGSRGRPLAHRTVRCTPDSPVNFSRTPLMVSRERRVRL